MAKKFALIGVGGYIAPRHLKAIKETGNELVAALDKSDSVGILDSYTTEARFFTEFERFDRHLEKLRRKPGQAVDYVSICSPNYLHDAHVRFALRIGAYAICEKPLVLNPWNVAALEELAAEHGSRINTILQLRLHPTIVALKQLIDQAPPEKVHDIDLTYITSRGHWYLTSWKGDVEKSGGIATNIGVHFFDMLTWIFGPVRQNVVHLYEPYEGGRVSGASARPGAMVPVAGPQRPSRAAGRRQAGDVSGDIRGRRGAGVFAGLYGPSHRELPPDSRRQRLWVPGGAAVDRDRLGHPGRQTNRQDGRVSPDAIEGAVTSAGIEHGRNTA